MTKRSLLCALASVADDGASLPDGSAVREKSRFLRYSASFSRGDETRVDGARFAGLVDAFFETFFAATRPDR